MKIYDNFLSKTYHKEILNLMTSNTFGWFYANTITTENIIGDDLSEYGFSHSFWEYPSGASSSSYRPFIMPMIYNIMDTVGSEQILRVRADMTLYSPTGYKHNDHTDFDFPNIAAVYYVNDSDGNTICLDQEVEPKSNRLVTFSGEIPHTGHSPSKHKNRILINSNFGKT